MTMQAPTSILTRGGALDALRFAAAFFMVVYHYAENAPVSLFDLHPALGRGYLATDFFLMLSGFVLAAAYGQRLADGRIGPVDFLKKRLLRVYPAHLVMVGAVVVLYLGASVAGAPIRNPQWFDWGQLPAQIFLVQAWGLPGKSGWNIVTWSLSALVFCYAVFPFVWRGFTRLKSPWLGLAAAIGFFAAVHAVTTSLLGYPVYQMPLQFGVLRALPLFILGAALAGITASVRLTPTMAGGLTMLGLTAIVGLQLDGPHNFLTLSAIALVMVAATAWRGAENRLAKEGAAISLSLFLTNYVFGVAWFAALRVVEARLGVTGPMLWVLWALALPAAVAFAVLFDRLIDRPIQRLIRRRERNDPASSRAKVSAPSPASAC